MKSGNSFQNNSSSNLFERTITNWLFTYIILAIAVYFFTPYPISLVVSVTIIVLMMISLSAFIMLKKMKWDNTTLSNNPNNKSDKGVRGIFDSVALWLYDDNNKAFGSTQLKFYCMSCGKEHKQRKCPFCGSMAVRAG